MGTEIVLCLFLVCFYSTVKDRLIVRAGGDRCWSVRHGPRDWGKRKVRERDDGLRVVVLIKEHEDDPVCASLDMVDRRSL